MLLIHCDIAAGANLIKATDYGSMSCVDDSESQFEAEFKSSAQCAKSGSCLDYFDRRSKPLEGEEE